MDSCKGWADIARHAGIATQATVNMTDPFGSYDLASGSVTKVAEERPCGLASLGFPPRQQPEQA